MTIKCVVPISGGKDSQACLKLAIQSFEKAEIVVLFCDTGFEHPLTYDHLDKIEQLYGVSITKVSDGDVITRCLRYGRFPNGVARFCTDDLKIKVSKRFYENLAAKQGCGFEVWYGMRSSESTERRKRYADFISTDTYAPHVVLPKKYPKFLSEMGVVFRLPILDLTSGEVFDILQGEHNPLYDLGFDRVGCFPCLASSDGPKKKAFEFDETGRKHFELVRIVEKRTGKAVYTGKGAICAICAI
jgi:3'-phosphoadenosine 5'-phosphosulfate sulfotransferase (PAPS reductase)/FAD synthetase